MFWGVSLIAGKKYSQQSPGSLTITMAALEPTESSRDKMVCLFLEKENSEYLLCTLNYENVLQMPLNLCIEQDETYHLYISGNGVVHVTGYMTQANGAKDANCSQVSISHYKETTEVTCNSVANGEEEEIGTNRLLDLDDSAEEDVEADEWEPNVSELHDAFGLEYMFGSRPRTRSKKAKHVNFAENTVVLADESYILPQLAMEDDDDDDYDNVESETESSTEDEEVDEEIDEEVGHEEIDEEVGHEEIDELVGHNESEEENVEDEISEDEEIIMTESVKKRKKPALTNNKLKRPKNVDANEVVIEYVEASTSSKKAKRKKKEKAFSSNLMEESVDNIKDADMMNSSIGRTPMPKKNSGSAMKSSSVPSAVGGKDSMKKRGKFSNKLSSGVEYEDLRVGAGPLARGGKIVHVYYIGQFPNGDVFEKLGPNEKTYSFRLGKGEVIKGWDVGIEGMRVGGKRKLKIPPSMAYGKKSMGPIPPHATLIFTVELKAVN